MNRPSASFWTAVLLAALGLTLPAAIQITCGSYALIKRTFSASW